MIDKESLTPDRLEALARLVIDRWEMDTLIDFAVSSLCADYGDNLEIAVEDAQDYELTVDGEIVPSCTPEESDHED